GEWWSNVSQSLGQPCGRGGAFPADPRQVNWSSNCRERFANPAQIFVGENCKNKRRLLIAKDFAPCLGENAGGGWIVRAIDDCTLVPPLKTRGPIERGKSSSNCRIVNFDFAGPDGRDRKSGILPLMRPRESARRLVIRRSHELDWRFTFGSPRTDHFFRFRSLRSANNRNLRLHNPSFFGRDFSKRPAQPLFVIEIDRRNDRDI